jgi:hypothetical protein
VFPLRSGLLVFCASNTVVVALRTRTLRPISAMRFTAMSDLLVVAPDTNRILVIFWTARKTKGGDSAAKLLTKDGVADREQLPDSVNAAHRNPEPAG